MTELLDALFRAQRVRASYRESINLESPSVRTMLTDYARFCHMYRSTAKATDASGLDPIAMALAEGRREAFLYLIKMTRGNHADIDDAIRKEMENAIE